MSITCARRTNIAKLDRTANDDLAHDGLARITYEQFTFTRTRTWGFGIPWGQGSWLTQWI